MHIAHRTPNTHWILNHHSNKNSRQLRWWRHRRRRDSSTISIIFTRWKYRCHNDYFIPKLSLIHTNTFKTSDICVCVCVHGHYVRRFFFVLLLRFMSTYLNRCVFEHNRHFLAIFSLVGYEVRIRLDLLSKSRIKSERRSQPLSVHTCVCVGVCVLNGSISVLNDFLASEKITREYLFILSIHDTRRWIYFRMKDSRCRMKIGWLNKPTYPK